VDTNQVVSVINWDSAGQIFFFSIDITDLLRYFDGGSNLFFDLGIDFLSVWPLMALMTLTQRFPILAIQLQGQRFAFFTIFRPHRMVAGQAFPHFNVLQVFSRQFIHSFH
jgi:hypothetical protein